MEPTTLFLLVTGVIGSFQVFMNAYMMTGGGPDNATTMIGLLIYNNAFAYGKYGLACAQAVLLAIAIAAIIVPVPVPAHGRQRRRVLRKEERLMATSGLYSQHVNNRKVLSPAQHDHRPSMLVTLAAC